MNANLACLIPHLLWKWTIVGAIFLTFGSVHCYGQDRNLVIMAGKPSHAPRIHEFNAGVQLLVKCLADVPGVNAKFILNGWPADESILESADAIVFYRMVHASMKSFKKMEDV